MKKGREIEEKKVDFLEQIEFERLIRIEGEKEKIKRGRCMRGSSEWRHRREGLGIRI